MYSGTAVDLPPLRYQIIPFRLYNFLARTRYLEPCSAPATFHSTSAGPSKMPEDIPEFKRPATRIGPS